MNIRLRSNILRKLSDQLRKFFYIDVSCLLDGRHQTYKLFMIVNRNLIAQSVLVRTDRKNVRRKRYSVLIA
nr:unnamed protein product [Callosobruchus chinensis]